MPRRCCACGSSLSSAGSSGSSSRSEAHRRRLPNSRPDQRRRCRRPSAAASRTRCSSSAIWLRPAAASVGGQDLCLVGQLLHGGALLALGGGDRSAAQILDRLDDGVELGAQRREVGLERRPCRRPRGLAAARRCVLSAMPLAPSRRLPQPAGRRALCCSVGERPWSNGDGAFRPSEQKNARKGHPFRASVGRADQMVRPRRSGQTATRHTLPIATGHSRCANSPRSVAGCAAHISEPRSAPTPSLSCNARLVPALDAVMLAHARSARPRLLACRAQIRADAHSWALGCRHWRSSDARPSEQASVTT